MIEYNRVGTELVGDPFNARGEEPGLPQHFLGEGEERYMLPDPPILATNPLLGWAIVAVAAIALVWVVLKILRKVISISIRVAIVVAVIGLVLAGLCWLSAVFGGGGLPFS